MTCYYVDAENNLVFTTESTQECAGYVAVTASEYRAFQTATDITSQDVTEAFSWGFGVVIFFWFLGYKIGIANGVIRKL